MPGRNTFSCTMERACQLLLYLEWPDFGGVSTHKTPFLIEMNFFYSQNSMEQQCCVEYAEIRHPDSTTECIPARAARWVLEHDPLCNIYRGSNNVRHQMVDNIWVKIRTLVQEIVDRNPFTPTHCLVCNFSGSNSIWDVWTGIGFKFASKWADIEIFLRPPFKLSGLYRTVSGSSINCRTATHPI